MQKHLMVIIGFALVLMAFEAVAQSDEIVVTGSRLSDYDLYEDGLPPYITLKKRASFLVRSVRVEGDTREHAKRETEVRNTLRNLLKAAKRNENIQLGIGSEFIEEFTEDSIAGDLVGGQRTQTSYRVLLIKTPVDDKAITYTQANDRIDKFIDSIQTDGRAEIIKWPDPVLSIVKPERFRKELLQLIAFDARNTAAQFGDDYAVRATNMAERIRWIQSDKLTLTLYIPYKLEILPKP